MRAGLAGRRLVLLGAPVYDEMVDAVADGSCPSLLMSMRSSARPECSFYAKAQVGVGPLRERLDPRSFQGAALRDAIGALTAAPSGRAISLVDRAGLHSVR